MLLDPHPVPPQNFWQIELPTNQHKIDWYRLNPVSYASALFFDRSGRGRFDATDIGYGICYLGETIEVTFIECFGRKLGEKFVTQEFLRSRNLFQIQSTRELCLVNLWGESLAKLGCDSRITSGADYGISRAWAKAIYHHPAQVDGIRYFSRHDNSRLCCGLFDRAQDNLVERNLGNLVDNHTRKLADILNIYDYGIL